MSHAVLGTFIHKNDSLSEIQLERARARAAFFWQTQREKTAWAGRSAVARNSANYKPHNAARHPGP